MAGQTAHRRADIQGLRALAVLLVVLYHADLGFSGGFIGVDVFFVISGFVITGLLLRELGATTTLALGTFYLRRIRRIVPALGLMVVVVAVLAVLAAPVGVQPIAARTGAAASVFVGNFYLYATPNGYFALDAALNPFLHTWSLAVEEQFYLVFPLILLGAWRVGRRTGRERRWAAAALLLTAVASFALSVAMVDGHAVLPGINDPRTFAFFSSLTRAWEFAAGALLALAAHRLPAWNATTARLVGLFGGIAVLGPALVYDDLTPFPGVNALPPVLGSVLLLAAGITGTVGVNRLLSIRPAVFIGDISYSWYLWHWPAIVFARAMWPGAATGVVAATISILPAWLSYRFVENPIRRSDRLTRSGTVLLGAGTMVAGIIACGGLLLGHRWIIGTDGYASVQQALRTHRACPIRGEGKRALSAGDPEQAVRCVWPAEDARGTVALVGDSNAGHIIEPVVTSARSLGYRVDRATSNGCPFVDVTMVVEGTRRNDCRRFYEQSVRLIERRRPDLVVIGSTTTRYLEEKQFGLIVGSDGPTARTPAAKAVAWERAMHRTVRRLDALGIPSLVVHPVPKFPGWDLRGCAAGRVAIDEFTCGRSETRRHAQQRGATALAAERQAIADVPLASGLSLDARLCSPTRCSTDRGRTWIYHDGDHLSIDGAESLTPLFERRFARQLGDGRSAQ
jgi:peptidoglycan/LPS O-acetylase OafA/YrhL